MDNKNNKSIAETMVDILHERDKSYIWYGDLDEIHECAKRVGLYERKGEKHPRFVNNRILSALDKSKKFEKSYIKYIGRPARCFTLKLEYR